MERRHFLKIGLGFVAGAAALDASVQAAPLAPHPLVEDGRLAPVEAEPAVVSGDEVEHLKPEEVRWHRRWHRRWYRRRWYRRRWHRHWHHRRWHRRHW